MSSQATDHPTLPDIVGHRGAALCAPENTLLSLRRAIADGADAVEVDVHLSRDGVVMVLHDETVDRTATDTSPCRTGAVADLTAAELAEVELPEGQRIPTLAQALEVCVREDGSPVPMLVEVKAVAAARAAVRELQRRHGDRVGENAVVISFYAEALRAVREAEPRIPLGYLQDSTDASTASVLRGLHAERLSVDVDHVTAAGAQLAREAGAELHVWTTNTAEQVDRALAAGAASLTTDDPRRIRAMVEARRAR
ncbi:glycerophosphodiester phosphodiesterase [Brachybacterium sp. EF45031]|uniref:glycerophosphodiester phosphodiesterase n=1 Tax=Brachybacterium sillae TaxID=2810536 RepID=UPI00217E429C|nr:glycerophosphodiester phosphodiesterase family protein [Brachybacterium sillae]MCS6711913.1 glycerophosphodiester phosphodiesterase [Brachybacterium sillae]